MVRQDGISGNSEGNLGGTHPAIIEENGSDQLVELADQEKKKGVNSILKLRRRLTGDDAGKHHSTRKAAEQGVNVTFDVPTTEPKSSLDQLVLLSPLWRKEDVSDAIQVPLPPSDASATSSDDQPTEAPLHVGRSLENLQIRPEAIPLPTEDIASTSKKKASPFLNWIAGPLATGSRRKRPTRKETVIDPTIAEEVKNYRNNVRRLADHFSNFSNVATIRTRHKWTSRIVLYDRLESEQHQPPRRSEPWSKYALPPTYHEFRRVLRNVADNCEQRVVLVEDLSPAAVQLLGATLDIPPHVFEEHLDRSGYKQVGDSHKSTSVWNPRSSAQGYSSVTWYRPVLPSLPLNTKLRERLIEHDISLRVRCPLEECKPHKIHISTIRNIWRRHLELCPAPGHHHKGSGDEYPVGWEERATVWSDEFDGCKFVVVLLDPLPVVVVDQGGNDQSWQMKPIPMGHQWIVKEEGRYTEFRPRARRSTRKFSRAGIDEWIDDAILASQLNTGSQDQATVPPQMQSEPQPFTTDHPQTTGAAFQGPEAATGTSVLRRRASKKDIESPPTVTFDTSSDFPHDRRNETKTSDKDAENASSIPPGPSQPPSEFPVSQPDIEPWPAIDSPRMSKSVSSTGADKELVATGDHGPFVPYNLVKARASSSARNNATFVTKHMRAYIESLQVPRSTLEEFDYFLQTTPKGKEKRYDPLHALFRAIHDDSHSLVDIIRVSLQRIRVGTLEEDQIQKNVYFWRALLNRLSFGLGEIDQNLRAFTQFTNESETHTSQALHFSNKLAEDTQNALRSCMNSIEKSSHSLLSEMQIIDSRKSIAEAESVSKLTELAFVFIPLSFVASLFSMQIHELDGGVPLWKFVITAIGIVLIAYAVRLSIRSVPLIEYKRDMFSRIRDDNLLQHNEPIPTHQFLTWVSSALTAAGVNYTKEFLASFAPVALVTAAFAAIVSPIVLLWLRNMDKGFTSVITVLLLLLDMTLVTTIVMQTSYRFDFNPRKRLREIQRAHQKDRERREKAKRRRRQKAGTDLEQYDGEIMSSSSEDSNASRSKSISVTSSSSSIIIRVVD